MDMCHGLTIKLHHYNSNCEATRWVFITDQGNILLYVGAVGQIGEYRVHILNVSDGDCQVCQLG